ncbi:hypothetical protein L596_001243 [Steinernema carpocapsae]|uniref:DDE Tnp4 domain-containing protein n=1 Tax=Steinernema carpocapsae TaxID=34508 RepID=A0A4U8UL81_STECR|nr:hypothetical protein L596_001243 [Steinernema carpocapsae]
MEDAYPDAALFRERFRLTQSQAERLLGIIGPRIRPECSGNFAMTAKQKILAALRFYASGSYYYNNGDAQGLCISIISTASPLSERAFGVLKGRFRCLFGLRVNTPEYSAEVIKACFALHNFNIETREMDDDNEYLNGSEEDDASEAEDEEIEANNEEQQFVNDFIQRCNIE